ncbi:MAG: GAF domain-containing protein [Desulforhopalus sp.]
MDNETEATKTVDIPKETLAQWQETVDLLAHLLDVPAALIMQLVNPDIEVCVASSGRENPYHHGDREKFLNSGLYCEAVIKNSDKLLIPNALVDQEWKDNPDVKLGMISYLGFPILQPDGKPFGTICVLDRKENPYSEIYENLLKCYRDIIQSQIELIYMNTLLGEENISLSEYIEEIKILRGIVPVCSYCKNIRDQSGQWATFEKFFQAHSEAKFSHGICPNCLEKEAPDVYGSIKKSHPNLLG